MRNFRLVIQIYEGWSHQKETKKMKATSRSKFKPFVRVGSVACGVCGGSSFEGNCSTQKGNREEVLCYGPQHPSFLALIEYALCSKSQKPICTVQDNVELAQRALHNVCILLSYILLEYVFVWTFYINITEFAYITLWSLWRRICYSKNADSPLCLLLSKLTP